MAGREETMDPISIQDLEAGNLDIDALINEVNVLQKRIEKIRYEMRMYMSTLATMDEYVTPVDVYNEVSNKIITLKTEFDSFFGLYKRLAPIIRYMKIKQGLSPDDSIKVSQHKVQIDAKLLNNDETSALLTSTTPGLASGGAVSSVSTPVVGGPVSTANTPTAKKNTVKTPKRKTTKKN